MASSVYTDLAAEARELNPEQAGIHEETLQQGDILVTRIRVETAEAAEALHKPIGRYITLDVPKLCERPLPLFAQTSKALAQELQKLITPLDASATVLTVGLGNRTITPDALGSRVIDRVYVTRHVAQYLPDAFSAPVRAVCAVAPGVLGVTGVETAEVVRGVAEHVKPSLILVIDSLASRRTARISTTIQLTDTGIQPGSGVGNARAAFTREAFDVPVIAIGVPMVVYASTIAQDTLSLLADKMGFAQKEEELRALAEKIAEESFGPLIVTPKDIDAIVTDMSSIVADGVNMALFGASYEQVRMLIA
ncbi:MAG: GPR endopeptidase [Eubacteriales bacterium]|nr:GPR endopeptidase [Eubacteriales bacterium]